MNGSSTTYGEIFSAQFPYYLSIGMSVDEYWHGEPELVRYYYDAFTLRRNRENQNDWRLGVYIQRAVASVLNGDKAPYFKRPLPLTQAEVETEKEKEEIENYEKALAQMTAECDRGNTNGG